jgi:hypothetical protein
MFCLIALLNKLAGSHAIRVIAGEDIIPSRISELESH